MGGTTRGSAGHGELDTFLGYLTILFQSFCDFGLPGGNIDRP